MTTTTDNESEITVVMPVYNAEKTVGAAIESVLRQTYANWKLICVDDGSTDTSLKILQAYEKKDCRITVLTKENGGVASARAMAYEIVDTPFVQSLDADDFFSDDLLANELKWIQKTGADAAAPDFYSVMSNGYIAKWNHDNHLIPGQEMSGNDAFRRVFIQPSMHCNNLWRSQLAKQFATGRIAEAKHLSADEFTKVLMFLNSKKIVISDGHYIYNYVENSVTRKFSIRHLGYLENCKKYIGLIDEYDIDAHTASIIKEYYFRHVLHLQIRLNRDKNQLSKEEYSKMHKALKNEYRNALRFKKDIKFAEKTNAWLYRTFTTNGYLIFALTCFLFAKK